MAGAGKVDSLDACCDDLDLEACAPLERLPMDTWGPYLAATRANLADTRERIAFDEFGGAKYLVYAIERVWRQENRDFLVLDADQPKRTKHVWHQNPDNMSRARWNELSPLRTIHLKIPHSWAIRQAWMPFWSYARCGCADRMYRGSLCNEVYCHLGGLDLFCPDTLSSPRAKASSAILQNLNAAEISANRREEEAE